MVKKEKKGKVVVKELPAKVKIIRQISEQERQGRGEAPSGLEQREEEVERELSSTESAPHFSQGNNFIPSQAVPQTATGNTAVQQRPQEDSEAVKKWYAQSTRLTPGRDEERYRLPFKQEFGQASSALNRRNIGGNQELMNLSGSSQDDDDQYQLVKPEKKETKRRYPWEA